MPADPAIADVVAAERVLEWLALAGTLAFAVSGALQAARHRLDIIGFVFMANLTGVGGGTIRDVLLDAPVFWVDAPGVLAWCTAAALVTWFAAGLVHRLSRALLWADAAGIAMFAVLGAQKALLLGASAPVAIVMGMFSACFGGILRDVTLNDPPILLRREIYVTAIVAGAGVFVALAVSLHVHHPIAIVAGVGTAFAVRAVAIARGLSLPGHRGTGAPP